MTATDLGLPSIGGLDGVPTTDAKQTAKDYTSDQEVRWCPGCGDYAVLAAVRQFLPTLGIKRENTVFVSGIGCSSRFPYYLNTYGMHSIHGRAPTIATGLATSREDLSVWVVTGDGDALSIGGNHLIHALRRNVNIKILLFNNRIYGLTKGQYSPTSEVGKVTKSTPMGSLDHPFNPISLALGAEASFVGRALDSDRKSLTAVLGGGLEHGGEALAVGVQRPSDEARLGPEGQRDRVERVVQRSHRGGLGDLPDLGGRGVLALGQPVDPVVEQQDLDVDVAAQGVDQVVAADGERVAVAGHDPDAEVLAAGRETGRDGRGAAVDGVHPVGVEVVREPRAAADAGDEDGVLALDAQGGEELADGGEDGVVAAAGAPADLLVGGVVLRGLLRVRGRDAVEAADGRQAQVGGGHACAPVVSLAMSDADSGCLPVR